MKSVDEKNDESKRSKVALPSCFFQKGQKMKHPLRIMVTLIANSHIVDQDIFASKVFCL